MSLAISDDLFRHNQSVSCFAVIGYAGIGANNNSSSPAILRLRLLEMTSGGTIYCSCEWMPCIYIFIYSVSIGCPKRVSSYTKTRLVTSPASAEPSSITVETTGLAPESRLKSKTEPSQYSSMHLLLQLPQVRSQ